MNIVGARVTTVVLTEEAERTIEVGATACTTTVDAEVRRTVFVVGAGRSVCTTTIDAEARRTVIVVGARRFRGGWKVGGGGGGRCWDVWSGRWVSATTIDAEA